MLRIAQRRLVPACLYSRLAGLLLCKPRGGSTGRALVLHCGHLGTSARLHHADDAASPDIAPYHDRQIAILNREEWGAWLDPSVSARTILKPLPPGSLAVQQVG